MYLINAWAMNRLLRDSYRDYCAKGVDYVCLCRTPYSTLKVYFFDVDEETALEPVCPHDHRYDFSTTVLRGAVTNTIWSVVPKSFQTDAPKFHKFEYRTPLLQGNGFTLAGYEHLRVDNAQRYTHGQTYRSLHATIHTLNMVQPGTILVVEQFEDRVPAGTPTSTYVPARPGVPPQPPALTGLYGKFTGEAMLQRLEQLERVSPGAKVWIQQR